MTVVLCPNLRDKEQWNIEDQGEGPNARNNNLKWQSVNLVVGIFIIEDARARVYLEKMHLLVSSSPNDKKCLKRPIETLNSRQDDHLISVYL